MENTLIIDGDCGICTHFGMFLKKYDKYYNYKLITLNQVSNNNEIIKNNISFDNINFIGSNNTYYQKSRAVFEAMKLTSGIFKIIGILGANSLVPIVINPFYNLIRDNRSRISSFLGYKACEINYTSKK